MSLRTSQSQSHLRQVRFQEDNVYYVCRQPWRHGMFRIFIPAIFVALVGTFMPAQTAKPPLRVAIVGLVHGHVHGFLERNRHNSEIEIVAVEEPNRELLA